MRRRNAVQAMAFIVIALGNMPMEAAPEATPTASPVLRVAMPVYPDLARRAGISGTVDVTAEIDAQGAVNVSIENSSNPLFNDAALQAARNWQLTPGEGHKATLHFRFSSLPFCSVPPQIAIYAPPYVVEVFAARIYRDCTDCPEQSSCVPVEITGAPVR